MSGHFSPRLSRTSKLPGAPEKSAGCITILSNDFFEAMLNPNMQYSCALFAEGDDLASAQLRKLSSGRLRGCVCRPGLRLLDIGCGWGGLARHAASRYGCHVVGITISREQFDYAQRWCRGLDVEIQLRDYREVTERFDRVVSVGMVEHVGYQKLSHVVTQAAARSTGRRWIVSLPGNLRKRFALPHRSVD